MSKKHFDDLIFDEWLDFVFDEKWKNDSDEEYIGLGDLNGDIEIFAENCIKLFENSEVLLDKFSSTQIESGFFDFILSPRISLEWFIWDKTKPIDLRRKLVYSMENVFKKVFTKISVEHSCFMWWDCLRNFDKDADNKPTQWIFETLSSILKIDSFDCQLSAIHGLGHIEHKEKKSLIETFLRRNPNFPEKEFALNAIEGNIL
jgi:hypothetical protein